jgi:hypothetical protein
VTWTGDVQLTVLDGGGSAVNVPASNVHVVMGCAQSGTNFQIVATRSPKTISDVFGGGIMPEAAGLEANAPGVVLCMKLPSTTAGSVRGASAAPVNITSSTNANPIVVTTSSPHGLVTGAIVTIAAHLVNTNANGTFPVTVLSPTTFSIPKTGNGVGGATGTVQPTGFWASMTGTSAVTADVATSPLDDYYVQIKVLKGGTIGSTGIALSISLDAGRTTGGAVQLGTANTLTIPGTGIIIDFGTGTLVTGDTIQFSTIAPIWASGDIATGLQALLSSPYAATGFGGVHLVGNCTGAIASLFQSASPGLEQLAASYIFTRGMAAARDASPPASWGGTAETESAWMTAIEADYVAASAKRVLAGAGHYNMQSAFANSMAGTPIFRRSLTWAQAARQITLAPQTHSGEVDLGALAQIIVDPTNDPKDGFIYHDERVNPGLDDFLPGGAARFCSARTRIGLPGYYIVNPRLLAPSGSVYSFWPMGAVIDVGCSIVHQVGQQEINSNVRTLSAAKGGTIYENDARVIEKKIGGAIRDNMVSTGMISDQTVTVDRTNNVQSTKKVNIAVELEAKGYILEEDITIGFAQASG